MRTALYHKTFDSKAILINAVQSMLNGDSTMVSFLKENYSNKHVNMTINFLEGNYTSSQEKSFIELFGDL